MANSIALAKNYVPILDEVYKEASLTTVLDAPADMIRAGAQANEVVVPKLTMSGLYNYSRNSGYTVGDVTLTYETITCPYDRGVMFQVDTLDDQETAGTAFGRLVGEFVRTRSGPEVDAYRIGQYASTTGIGSATGTLSTGANAVTALRAAIDAMDNAEAPRDTRYLFITPTIKGMIDDLDTTKSRAVMESWAQVIVVPASRMYKTVTLANTSSGGFSGAGAVNFLAVEKSAVVQFLKHVSPKVITPEQNQAADAWKFGYRAVGAAKVYDNKLGGVYVHYVAASGT